MDLGRNILRKTPKFCFSLFENKPALLNFLNYIIILSILQVILAKDDLKLNWIMQCTTECWTCLNQINLTAQFNLSIGLLDACSNCSGTWIPKINSQTEFSLIILVFCKRNMLNL